MGLMTPNGDKSFKFKEAYVQNYKLNVSSSIAGMTQSGYQYGSFSGQYIEGGIDDYIYALKPGFYFLVQLDYRLNFKTKMVYAKCENGKEVILKNYLNGNTIFVLAL